jgi:hypothetical protein
MIERNAVDSGFERRVDDLDDQHEQHAANQKRALRAVRAEEPRARNEHDSEENLQPERRFVACRGCKARERVARRVHDAAQATLSLEGTVHRGANVARRSRWLRPDPAR